MFDIGKKNTSAKLGAYETRTLMKLKGTKEGFNRLSVPFMLPNQPGYPSFKFIDVLDICQIKMHYNTIK